MVIWDRSLVIVRGLCVVLGVILWLAVPGVARAAVDTVTTTSDSGSGSLRAVIAASGAGDTITFDPSLDGQTITLTSGAVVITHSLNISGPGAGSLTINGNHTGTVFDIEANSSTDDVTISGVTITGGAISGRGSAGGGGIFANSVATLTLDGDTITGNEVTVSSASSTGGGGVLVNGGDVVVTDSTITNNGVTLTGALANSNGGGGLYSQGGTVSISGSTISDNTVDQSQTSSSGSDGGGGIYDDGGDVTVTASTIADNTVNVDSSQNPSDGGGGIYNAGGQISLGDATVTGNTFTLSNSTADDNGGGGVYSEGGDVAIVSSSLADNRATVENDTSTRGTNGGGGLYSEGGNISIVASSISGNAADVTATAGSNGGGAILDQGSHSVYLNSTFSGNAMTISSPGTLNGGGAIWTFGGSLISNLTIAANQTNAAGGAIFSEGSIDLKNTILADNTAAPAGTCAGPGAFSSAGFNLESANTCGLTATGDLVNTEPRLGMLQNNGGPTSTQALAADSPAVDAGSCTDILGHPLSTDQRGVARPQPAGGQCDIGAYELVPASAGPPPAPSPSPTPPAPPTAVPAPPAATSSTGASFSGSVNPEGLATTVFFQYGIDSRFRPGGRGAGIVYDQSTPPQSLPADATPHAVSASVSGLVPHALYHVRLVASNGVGTTFGPDQTFTTPAGPAPAPPVVGQRIVVKPVAGQVFVLVGTKLVPLTEASQLPSGAIVDARAGSLKLTAAEAGRGRETGVFGGAIFKLTQTRAGLTTLALVEGAFAGAPTYATCRAHKTADATATALSRKTLQLLHATAHGKFRTRGRYSAATVRGTKWTIADRCDGTLTRDILHSVLVTDFVRHKTTILHAGQSYLARAPARRRRK